MNCILAEKKNPPPPLFSEYMQNPIILNGDGSSPRKNQKNLAGKRAPADANDIKKAF